MRTKCSLGLLLAASLSFSYGAAADSAPSSLASVTQVELDRAVESAHSALWSKFIGADGLIHDYVGELPTPEECALGKPNAIGWWSPIENGPMFTGSYLAAICQRARLSGAAADREQARRLAKGLLACASVSDVPGFIARGMGTDGKCHGRDCHAARESWWFFAVIGRPASVTE